MQGSSGSRVEIKQVVVALPVVEAAQLIAAANAVLRNIHSPEQKESLRSAARRLAEQSGIPYHSPDERN